METKKKLPKARLDSGPIDHIRLFEKLLLVTDQLDSLLEPGGVFPKNAPHIIRPEFEKLASDQQTQFVERMQFFYEVCVEAITHDYQLLEDTRLIWHALSKLKVRPPSDL